MVRLVRILKILTIVITTFSIASARAGSPELSKDKACRLFFVLGMLHEPAGRYFVENGDAVEWCTENLRAYVLWAYLEQIKDDHDIGEEIQIEKPGRRIVFRGTQLNELINSFYKYEFTGFSQHWLYKETRRCGTAYLSYDLFDQGDSDPKYAYLAGAYYMFGRGDQYAIWCNSRKLDLIAALLVDVGCTNVTTPRGNDHKINFFPTEELKSWFKRYPGVWAFDKADSLMGFASDEEVTIYRTVLGLVQKGKIEGCEITGPCGLAWMTHVLRDTPDVPGLPAKFQAAIHDLENRNEKIISLRNCENDAIHMLNLGAGLSDTCGVRFSRIGISGSGIKAVVVMSCSCKESMKREPDVLVVLEKKRLRWRAVGYSIEQPRRWPPKEFSPN